MSSAGSVQTWGCDTSSGREGSDESNKTRMAPAALPATTGNSITSRAILIARIRKVIIHHVEAKSGNAMQEDSGRQHEGVCGISSKSRCFFSSSSDFGAMFQGGAVFVRCAADREKQGEGYTHVSLERPFLWSAPALRASSSAMLKKDSRVAWPASICHGRVASGMGKRPGDRSPLK